MIRTNRETAYQMIIAMLSRALPMAMNFGTAIILTIILSPEEQGYYFTFTSFIALTVFVDSGMAVVIIQFIAHERAKLHSVSEIQIVGPDYAKSRISGSAALAVKWYCFGSLIVGACILALGSWFFSKDSNSQLQPITALSVACIGVVADISQAPLYAALMGLGFAKWIYTIRVIKSVIVSLALWFFFIIGLKLYSIGVSLLVGAITGFILTIVRFGPLILQIYRCSKASSVSWTQEILPMQWRLAVSWICGYFIFQLFSPISFYFLGSTTAGQVGVTMALALAILSVSNVIVESQQPAYGMLIAKRDWKALNVLSFNTSIVSVVVACAAAILSVVVLLTLKYFGVGLYRRFLPTDLLVLFLIGSISNTIISAIAGYLRAHKKEPFMIISIGFAVLQTPTLIVACRIWGVYGLGAGFALVSTAIVPIAWLVLRGCQENWHTA